MTTTMESAKKAPQQKKSDFVAQNWKHLSAKELEKLSPIERSRYFAYEPSPHAASIKTAQQRLHQDMAITKEKQNRSNLQKAQAHENLERNRQLGLVKATEAGQRTRNLRDTYIANRASEIRHLVSTQQTALKATRLQTLLPCENVKVNLVDEMSAKRRMRIEELIEEDLVASTGRILC